jgi:hypothetical protein
MLAIIIPYYKISFFEATLKALATQTNKEFKVYIGNDASLENPDFLIEKYKEKFDFEYKVFDENLGSISLVQQWERCMEMVQNEKWLMILGDDDVVEPNFVASFYENLKEIENLKINVIRYATVVIDENGNEITPIYVHPKLEKVTDFYQRKYTNKTRSSLSEYIFRKEVLLKIKFKDLQLAWYSDLLAVLEVAHFGIIFTINESVVSFRHSCLNISSDSKSGKLKNLAAFEFYFYLLEKNSYCFSDFQKELICNSLEKTFLDNKKNVYFWKRFTALYLTNSYFRRYVFFIFKIFKSVFKISFK